MQERASLVDALEGIGKVERELDDNVEMIALGEAENDNGGGGRGRERAEGPEEGSRAPRAGSAVVGRGRQVRFLSRSACRRRRHRKPGLGVDAAAHVYALGRGAQHSASSIGKARRRSRHQIRHHPDQRAQRLWLAEDGSGRAPPRADLAVRLQRAPAHVILVGRDLSRCRRRSIKIDIKESDVRTDTMRGVAPAASTSTRPKSAVRLTHIPTGVAVVSAGRSQHKNRAQASDMLRAALRNRVEKARGTGRRRSGRQDRHRLGPPDPLLRAAALPDGEGPAHRRADFRYVRCARRRSRRVHGGNPGAARIRHLARRGRGCGLAHDEGRIYGAGRMGHGMAGRYLDAGFSLAVWRIAARPRRKI